MYIFSTYSLKIPFDPKLLFFFFKLFKFLQRYTGKDCSTLQTETFVHKK